ncbi:unnamed protein product [Auanema sp. JU1783]|nr:unnamed protein product [Auanema sp. JU1783]
MQSIRTFFFFIQIAYVSSVILRVNENGLGEAANFTRQWLAMAGPHMRIPEIRQDYDTSFSSGEVRVFNISINKFVPPLLRFRPSDHSFLYMSTLSGYAQVSAEWTVQSSFLSVFDFPIQGQISAQMTGLISEIAMQITSEHEVEVHHCNAQIRDLRLNIDGGIAAELLQFFRTSVTRAIRRRLEEEYCHIMENYWLPWVEGQLSNFPTNLTISQEPPVILVQSLHSIAMTQDSIDFRMRSDLSWNNQFVESAPLENISTSDIGAFGRSSRMIDMFVDEPTVQSILTAAHFAGHLRTVLDTPFLRTDCEVLCVGTVLPELAEVLPNSTMKVEASTLSPPVIMLQDGKSVVFLNASLEVYPDPVIEKVNGSILTIHMETEFILTMEMKNRKVKGFINMVNANAVLIDSKIGLMSQKTINFLVNMSTPFLEDAVDLLIGRGVFVKDPFQFPSTNEQLSFKEGFIRWEADLAIPNIMRHTWVM